LSSSFFEVKLLPKILRNKERNEMEIIHYRDFGEYIAST